MNLFNYRLIVSSVREDIEKKIRFTEINVVDANIEGRYIYHYMVFYVSRDFCKREEKNGGSSYSSQRLKVLTQPKTVIY